MPPRLARLLAALAAIALVAGAFVVRGALAGDDGGDDRAGTGDRRHGAPGDGDGAPVRLVCDEDVGEEACAALADAAGAEVEVLPAGEVIERAVAADADWDAWLTLDGVPGVLDVALDEEDLPLLVQGDPVPVASSPLALLALPDQPCEGDTVAWTCLADPAQATRNGVAVPSADTALGILARAAGATGLAGGPDLDRSFLDTSEADLLRDLLGDSPREAGTTTAAQTASLFSPGVSSAAVTIEGLARVQARKIRGQERGLRVLPVEPTVAVGVVLVGLSERGDGAVAALQEVASGQTVQEALDEAGWTGEAGPTTGLPDNPGLIYALREELGR
ncbi:MAG TPA: hypothetical protein VFU19_11665 [Iamia sp.]|nr:hypothetical protein [Iamia sp.]